MGLDITVNMVKSIGNKNPQDIDDFDILSESPNLTVFTHLAFERVNEYYDLETAIRNIGYKLDDLKWIGTSYHGAVQYTYKNKIGEEVVITDPPIIYKKELCIFSEEIGYQRKGANKKFYDDGMWDGVDVVEKWVLLEHWNKYFSDTEDLRRSFKENIVDKFIEGSTFVCYC